MPKALKIDPGEAFNTMPEIIALPRYIRTGLNAHPNTFSFDTLPEQTQHEFMLTLHTILNTTEQEIARFFIRQGAEYFHLRDNRSPKTMTDQLLVRQQHLRRDYARELGQTKEHYERACAIQRESQQTRAQAEAERIIREKEAYIAEQTRIQLELHRAERRVREQSDALRAANRENVVIREQLGRQVEQSRAELERLRLHAEETHRLEQQRQARENVAIERAAVLELEVQQLRLQLTQKANQDTAHEAIPSPSPYKGKQPAHLSIHQAGPAASQPIQTQQLPRNAFGKDKWAIYFGDVGVEPPLPPNIYEILESRPPFLEGRSVQETHMLVLIPSTVNGKPLTLNSIGKLVESPLQGNKTCYSLCGTGESRNNTAVTTSYWVLMTKEALPEGFNKPYTRQQELVARCARESHINYEMPRVLEAVICIFTEFVSSGARFYEKTYTNCEETDDTDGVLALGAFSSKGLWVSYCHACSRDAGFACLVREFTTTLPFAQEQPVSNKVAVSTNELGLVSCIQGSSIHEQTLPRIAFGKEKWATYFGDVGEEPSLPTNIYEILESRPPFLEGRSVEETHTLVLIPGTVNGKLLTLNSIGELVESPLQGNKTGYRIILRDLIKEYGDIPVTASYWVLMTKDVLPESWDRGSYVRQEEFASRCGREFHVDYKVPKMLEAAVCMFTQFVSAGELPNGRSTTSCQEKIYGYAVHLGYFFSPTPDLSPGLVIYMDLGFGMNGLCRMFGGITPTPVQEPSRILDSESKGKEPIIALTNESVTSLDTHLRIIDRQVLPKIAFGKEKWATYFGDVGEEPPLPPNIYEILQRRPPFLNGKSIEETHMLTLIPRDVNGTPLTLKSINELVQSPLQGNKAYCESRYKDCNRAIATSYWVLMAKEISIPMACPSIVFPPGIEKYAEEAQIEYQRPLVLEAVVCSLIEIVSSGGSPYGDSWISCIENMQCVGGFSAGCLKVEFSAWVFGEQREAYLARKFYVCETKSQREKSY